MKQAKMIDKRVRARRADSRDAEVGRRVRSRRLECRLSQTELADRCGVTFQQVQKYEKGVNRIGASRLEQIAEALEVPISFFFGGGATGSSSREHAITESVFGFMQTWGGADREGVSQDQEPQCASAFGWVGRRTSQHLA